MLEYTNRNGNKFYIDTEEALVPEDADYFGYLFTVRLHDEKSDFGRVYKAIVKKELCDTEKKAKMWLNTSAFDFLKTILETYKDDQTLLLIPNSNKWWVI